jgi:hypothetical protein
MTTLRLQEIPGVQELPVRPPISRLASTGLSPLAASWIRKPSGRRIETVVVGITLVPAFVSSDSSFRCGVTSRM